MSGALRHVTFAVAQAPFGVGDKLLVPASEAARLEAEGLLSANEPWGPVEAAAQKAHKRPILSVGRPVVADRRMAR